MNSTHRRVRTLERGVEWLPRHDSHYILARMMVSARHAPPICIQQSTLRELDDLVHAAPEFSFGLLTGDLCTCRRSERDYTLIDGLVECALPEEEGDIYGLIALALRERIVLLERAGSRVIGFYMSNTSVIPKVAPEDVALFRSVFQQPWSVMLLRDRVADGEVGAFIRVESVDERPYAAPFTELVAGEGGRRRKEAPRTMVRWTNYQPTEIVTSCSGVEARKVSEAGAARDGGLLVRGFLGRTIGRVGGSGSLWREFSGSVRRSRRIGPASATTGTSPVRLVREDDLAAPERDGAQEAETVRASQPERPPAMPEPPTLRTALPAEKDYMVPGTTALSVGSANIPDVFALETAGAQKSGSPMREVTSGSALVTPKAAAPAIQTDEPGGSRIGYRPERTGSGPEEATEEVEQAVVPRGADGDAGGSGSANRDSDSSFEVIMVPPLETAEKGERWVRLRRLFARRQK
jgi:hypothetical protein